MILRNGKFSGKILRKIFRAGKFSVEHFPPHITSYSTITAATFKRRFKDSAFLF
jgi:hypothetical protein